MNAAAKAADGRVSDAAQPQEETEAAAEAAAAAAPDAEPAAPAAEGVDERAEVGPKRLSVTLRARELRHLAEATEGEGISANEAIRQAISVDAIVRDAKRRGRKVLVEDEDGNFSEIILVM